MKLFAVALGFACLLIPVGTQARTGLLCIAVLGVLMLREVKRRFVYIAAAGALGLVALPFLPQTWYERMATLESHEEDTSASTRVAVWEWTIDYANSHPMGGGFDAYRGNNLQVETVQELGPDNNAKLDVQVHEEKARAYHSAYFEMLGEQGYPGFLLWAWIHFLGLWQMERLRRRWKDRAGAGQQWQAPLAMALQFAQVIYLVGSLFQGIAYQPFILTLVGVQCALWSWCRNADSVSRKRPRRHLAPPRAGDAVTAPVAPLR